MCLCIFIYIYIYIWVVHGIYVLYVCYSYINVFNLSMFIYVLPIYLSMFFIWCIYLFIYVYGLQLYFKPIHNSLPEECEPYLWTTLKIDIPPFGSMKLRRCSTRHQDVRKRNHSSTKHHLKKYALVWFKLSMFQIVLNFAPTPVTTHHSSRTNLHPQVQGAGPVSKIAQLLHVNAIRGVVNQGCQNLIPRKKKIASTILWRIIPHGVHPRFAGCPIYW